MAAGESAAVPAELVAGSRRRQHVVGAVGVAAIVLVVVVPVVVGTVFGFRGSSHPRPVAEKKSVSPAGLASSGRVVSETGSGVVFSDPSGGRQVRLPALGQHRVDEYSTLTAALDLPVLASSDGKVFAVIGDRLSTTAVADAATFTQPTVTSDHDPFSESDQALVARSFDRSSPGAPLVSVVDLADGATVRLGFADDAAGDPWKLGAFVSVPASGTVPAPLQGIGVTDSRIELRDAGVAPVVMATAADLNRDVGQDPARPVNLMVFPEPTGDVAVVVNPVDGSDANAGVAVLDRQGHLIAAVPAGAGPYTYAWPTWSPNNLSLVWYSYGGGGAQIAVWRVGGPVRTRQAPNPGARFDYCLWAPDSTAVLCPNDNGGIQSSYWVLGDDGNGPLITVPAPGRPIAWYPAED